MQLLESTRSVLRIPPDLLHQIPFKLAINICHLHASTPLFRACCSGLRTLVGRRIMLVVGCAFGKRVKLIGAHGWRVHGAPQRTHATSRHTCTWRLEVGLTRRLWVYGTDAREA
jgi:hypothetical protein